MTCVLLSELYRQRISKMFCNAKLFFIRSFNILFRVKIFIYWYLWPHFWVRHYYIFLTSLDILGLSTVHISASVPFFNLEYTNTEPVIFAPVSLLFVCYPALHWQHWRVKIMGITKTGCKGKSSPIKCVPSIIVVKIENMEFQL